ncbi:MAG TPA: response regulator transcription factor [Solirubrobacteraceae bacterium]|jgi:two-component system nitrate/nitrite response regulator NarL|nr:response regulator transcription factor [Solirubrobacteraceae bacterium]
MAPPCTVLCADDHPLYLSSVVRALEEEPGVEVVAQESDGRAAFAAIAERSPDVAVVDMTMPHMTGAELVEAVVREGLSTRVLILTGDVGSPDVYRALVAGAAGVLSKLVETRALVDAVVSVSRGQTVIAPEAQGSLVQAMRSQAVEERPLLTPRETEILRHVADGLSVTQIAKQVYLSPSTVKTHLDHIYRKLEVGDRAAAVATAMRTGLLV